MTVCPEELKLVALDKDDIEVVSAHVQDALVRVGDIFWQPREHRFVMALNRFDWMTAVDASAGDQGRLPALPHGVAVRAGAGCKCRDVDPANKRRRAQSAGRRIRRARFARRQS